jgi:hypothetical protein
MNFDQFWKKNLGIDVKVRPMARSENVVQTPIDDLWRVQNVESKAVELLNLRTKQSVEIRGDNFREFRTPNFLILRCQLTLTEEQVLIEPIVGGGPEPVTDRALSALAPERPTIRENSATEILSSLRGITLPHQFDEKVKDLYQGRWTRGVGWRATVNSLPSKLPKDRWFCPFKEIGSDTLVMACTAQDVSALRPGDSVTVSGRISDVAPFGSVSLDDAVVVRDESRGALGHEENDAG